MKERSNLTLTTHPPAKLNLFLELLGKRADGFHELDTVMVPIDWCDKLSLRCSDHPGIDLTVRVPTSPNLGEREKRPAIEGTEKAPDSSEPESVPSDQRNLVYRALAAFQQTFQIQTGFLCDLTKRIPAGAGLGGASSDAASALLLAARLHDIAPSHPDINHIAKTLGSDIPFFLGCPDVDAQPGTDGPFQCRAARGTGRGEIIERIECPATIHFVVVFPLIGLSTPMVYSHSVVPSQKHDSQLIRDAIQQGKTDQIARLLWNRLETPAKKLATGVKIALELFQRVEVQGYQMTGSGSACFGIVKDENAARRCADTLKEQLGSRYIIQVARSTDVPGLVH